MNAKNLAKYTFACSYIGKVLGEAAAVSKDGAAWAIGEDYVVWLNIEKEGINVQIYDAWEMPDQLYQVLGYCQYHEIPCHII